MIKNVHFNVDIYIQPKEQKIVIQTISALMDGIEGIR